MTINLPLGTDPLNAPDHALSHRVFANDEASPEQSVVVDVNGDVVLIGTITATNFSGINTGDQVVDGITITGAGTIGSPFVVSSSNVKSLFSAGTGIAYDNSTGVISNLGVLSLTDTLASVTARGATTGIQLVSTLATGSAPLVVASTTLNTNLNADLLDGQHASDFVGTGTAFLLDQTTPQTIINGAPIFNAGLSVANQLTSTLAIGTSPFAVTSTTVNTNLNADLLDGQHGAYYATAAGYLKLDQTTPQTVANGMPVFSGGAQFANLKITGGGGIYPSADSTTALYINKTDNSTHIMTVDSTNNIVSFGTNTAGGNVNVVGTLGTELVPAFTDANWTLGAGWLSPIVGATLNKNADGVGTATPTTPFAAVVGTRYKVVVTAAAGGSNYLLMSFGGEQQYLYGAQTSQTYYITALTTASLIISGFNSTSRMNIQSISIKAMTQGALNVDGISSFYGPLKLYSTTGSVTYPFLEFIAPGTNFYGKIYGSAEALRFNMGATYTAQMTTAGWTFWNQINAYGGLWSQNDIVMTAGYKIKPSADSTTALNIANAAGTAQVIFDTTNGCMTLKSATNPYLTIQSVAGGLSVLRFTGGTNERSTFYYDDTNKYTALYNAASNSKIMEWTDAGNVNIPALTASKLVFTDASKNLTSTGIGTSAQFIKGDGSLDSTVVSGTYNPTIAGVTNFTSGTAYTAQYMRVGNTVTVSGKVNVVTIGMGVQWTLSLPISSSFTQDYQAAGTGILSGLLSSTPVVSIRSTASASVVTMDCVSLPATSDVWYQFTYQIL
jgi:hypothetical protein